MKLQGFIISFFIVGALAACSSQQLQYNYINESDYVSVIEKNTEHKQIYDGLVNILEVNATLQNSETEKALLLRQAQNYQWDEGTVAQEKTKRDAITQHESTVFVSMFTPERKNDDLAKSKTLWKIFLDVNGHRYEGKATKLKLTLSEVANLYPAHTRWSTPYRVTFNVPVSAVDSGAKLTMTGPVGSIILDFKK